MAIVTVTRRDGTSLDIAAETGLSLMEAIRGAQLDEMQALCGGCCSCATCHVYLDDAHSALLSGISEDENDLLDGSSHRIARSRLSCQIMLDGLDRDLRVTIAPED